MPVADNQPQDEHITGHVVVVGAGPLGITAAVELADAGHHVLLIESGGLRPDERIQSLSEEPSGPLDPWHASKSHSVLRAFGGTSALWGGRCVPFDEVDLSPRPGHDTSLWPIPYDELRRYFGRACEWCACGEPTFNAREIAALAGEDLAPGLRDDEVRTTDLERWALPTRFGRRYRRRVLRHPLITTVLGFTCVRIQLAKDGAGVDHLQLRALDGRSKSVRGRFYVLATGGLEATRLLLASNDVATKGIGNHSGHLGRWYMAHVEARVGEAHFTTDPSRTIYDHERDRDGVYVKRRFSVSPDVQEREKLLNSVAWLVNPPISDPSHGSGILSGVYLTLISPLGRFLLAEAIRVHHTQRAGEMRLAAHLKNILRDIVPSARFAIAFTWRRILKPGRKAPGFFVASAANVYPLHYHGEHLPHWESYVELSDEQDALGVPRLRTHLHFDDQDIANVRATLSLIDQHLRSTETGYIKYSDNLEDEVWDFLKTMGGYHQTGTTRMSADRADGVVDANLAVHGVPDLFVCSTSVLPTSSQANPTLTGVALAVRLAGYIAAASRPPTPHRLAGRLSSRLLIRRPD